jgi:hypothetical protein
MIYLLKTWVLNTIAILYVFISCSVPLLIIYALIAVLLGY